MEWRRERALTEVGGVVFSKGLRDLSLWRWQHSKFFLSKLCLLELTNRPPYLMVITEKDASLEDLCYYDLKYFILMANDFRC